MAQCVSIKLQSNFIEIALRHGHSPVNLLHIFRTPFSHNTSERLFLRIETVTLLKRDSGRSVFLSILQNKFSQKNSIVDVRLGSKYALASDRYWQEKLIVEKNQKVINFKVETSGKKIVIVFRGVIRTLSNIYNGAFLIKQLTVKSC